MASDSVARPLAVALQRVARTPSCGKRQFATPLGFIPFPLGFPSVDVNGYRDNAQRRYHNNTCKCSPLRPKYRSGPDSAFDSPHSKLGPANTGFRK
eukprot:5038547-Pyramimonas_sp.AAC.1